MKELTVQKQEAIITINFEEVKESLIKTMEQYKGIVVTEEQLKICKETQKELSKMRLNIDNYRKAIKKEMEQPIKAFEKQCKELISLVEEAESPIKEGIKIFDDKRLYEKKAKVSGMLQVEMERQGVKGGITIDDIKVNLSNSFTDIQREIEDKVKAQYYIETGAAITETEETKLNITKELPIGGDKWFVSLEVEHNKEALSRLKLFLEVNGYEFKVVKQGRC